MKENGYQPSDIDRVVFIGGPTRMPIIRSRVPQQLGIAGRPGLRSNDRGCVWRGDICRKPGLEERVGGIEGNEGDGAHRWPVKIEYGYPERTSDARIRIRIKPQAGATGKGHKLQVDSDMGWTSGQLPLDATNSVNDVPVARRGDNKFRIIVFDASGTPIPNVETRIIVKRTDATASGAPVTHTIAVKVVEGDIGAMRNTLDELVEKGHPIPASGVKDFRAAKRSEGRRRQVARFRGVSNGARRHRSDSKSPRRQFSYRRQRDLERGDVIRRGDRIRVHWKLDENGLLDCALEVEAIGRRFDTGKMFTDQGAQKNFEGQEGEELANSVLTMAQAELEKLQETLGSRTASDAAELTSRIERQKDNLKTSYEADTRRSIVEEGRAIRQEISKIKNKRENIGEVLQADMEGLIGAFDAVIRQTVNSSIPNDLIASSGKPGNQLDAAIPKMHASRLPKCALFVSRKCESNRALWSIVS